MAALPTKSENKSISNNSSNNVQNESTIGFETVMLNAIATDFVTLRDVDYGDTFPGQHLVCRHHQTQRIYFIVRAERFGFRLAQVLSADDFHDMQISAYDPNGENVVWTAMFQKNDAKIEENEVCMRYIDMIEHYTDLCDGDGYSNMHAYAVVFSRFSQPTGTYVPFAFPGHDDENVIQSAADDETMIDGADDTMSSGNESGTE